MVDITLPAHLADQVSAWASQNNISPEAAADAVRRALAPADDVRVVSGDGAWFYHSSVAFNSTTRPDLEVMLVVPHRHNPRSDSVLWYGLEFHRDGSVRNNCDCGDHTGQRITPGENVKIGEWLWSGHPHFLTGWHVIGAAK